MHFAQQFYKPVCQKNNYIYFSFEVQMIEYNTIVKEEGKIKTNESNLYKPSKFNLKKGNTQTWKRFSIPFVIRSLIVLGSNSPTP